MKAIRIILLICLVLWVKQEVLGQSDRLQIAVVSIDTKGIDLDNETMSGIVRLELEKIDRYEVLDKYDVSDILSSNNIDPESCFGKSKVVKAGEYLGADKMLTGSVERIHGKIIFILRLVDVDSKRIEKSSVMEFLDLQNEIQTMTLITLNELLGIENEEHIVDLLINYSLPITSAKTTVNLNGPRIGVAFTMGDNGQRMQDPKDEGGYDMFPVTSMFGYQFEQQYLSSGDFQALIEGIVAVNGLESGHFIPAITVMNGFRFNNTGIEFGVGPNFRLVRVAEGYYDAEDNWHIGPPPEDSNYEQKVALDNRGDLKLNLGLVVAIGKTFRSGYLNVPLNVYFIPRKTGSVLGMTFGFNTTRRPKL